MHDVKSVPVILRQQVHDVMSESLAFRVSKWMTSVGFWHFATTSACLVMFEALAFRDSKYMT